MKSTGLGGLTSAIRLQWLAHLQTLGSRASLPTLHLSTSLHTAFPMPEACLLSWSSSGFQMTKPCLLPEEPPGVRQGSSHDISFLTHSAQLGASG